MTTVRVYGIPKPQGSKFAVARGGKAVVVDARKPALASWRQAVIDACDGAGWSDQALALDLVFILPRPRSHYGTGRNAGVLKDSAPEYPSGLPDLDKLARSTMDALTASGWWRDDAQVVTLIASKVYGDRPGAEIRMERAK
jgi:crossover junction endodeoxyribonuclease RusA